MTKISKNKTIGFSPPTILALGFLTLIIIGTLLLKLPFSHVVPVTWLDAFFTATSAVTITGLSVVPINETFSMTGQVVILLLIQLGGLGFITFAILSALNLSPQLGLKHQLLAQNAIGETNLSNITVIAKAIFIYTLFFEFIGFLILWITWSSDLGLVKSSFYALFYSISAFNNAGFSLYNDSLMGFQDNIPIFLTISTLYIIGGIGFVILIDIKRRKKWKKLSTNSKAVLMTILIINIVAFSTIWLIESRNPLTLANMSLAEQATHAWFQATAPRSSGFNSIDTASMNNASAFLTMMLMFIGGGSLSTAGGIKIGTFIILVLSVISFFRRQDEVIIFNHSISNEQVFKALAVTATTAMFIIIGSFILLAIEKDKQFIDVIFEVVSAACTVGLSRGITGQLHAVSTLILIFLMYVGRIGPITLIYLIATPKKSRLKHPSSDIQIG